MGQSERIVDLDEVVNPASVAALQESAQGASHRIATGLFQPFVHVQK